MKTIRLETLTRLDRDTALCLGFFDGIHLGHLKILDITRETGRRENLAPALFTFESHPLEVLNPGLCFPYLTTLEERKKIAFSEGIEYFISCEFTRDFASISPEDFIIDVILSKLRGKSLIVGADYHFGEGGRGDIKLLKKLAQKHGVNVVVVPEVKIEGEKISSTHIRESIMGGEIEKANHYLGRWYSIEGRVHRGKNRGKKLGIPTANLRIPDKKVIPRRGVYCVLCLLENHIYKGIGHVGNRPTFKEEDYNIEIHLFDFKKDIYSQKIRVFFINYIRDTLNFDNPWVMKKKINQDICVCREKLKDVTQEKILNNLRILSSPV